MVATKFLRSSFVVISVAKNAGIAEGRLLARMKLKKGLSCSGSSHPAAKGVWQKEFGKKVTRK